MEIREGDIVLIQGAVRGIDDGRSSFSFRPRTPADWGPVEMPLAAVEKIVDRPLKPGDKVTCADSEETGVVIGLVFHGRIGCSPWLIVDWYRNRPQAYRPEELALVREGP